MASGALCVIIPLIAMMQMLCAKWQATQALSVLSIIPDMAEDMVGSYIPVYLVTNNNMPDLKVIFIVQGPIWLENIGCSSGDEVLEDCNHLNWGSYSYYYCDHSDDVGVICTPSKNITALIILCYLFTRLIIAFLFRSGPVSTCTQSRCKIYIWKFYYHYLGCEYYLLNNMMDGILAACSLPFKMHHKESISLYFRHILFPGVSHHRCLTYITATILDHGALLGPFQAA